VQVHGHTRHMADHIWMASSYSHSAVNILSVLLVLFVAVISFHMTSFVMFELTGSE